MATDALKGEEMQVSYKEKIGGLIPHAARAADRTTIDYKVETDADREREAARWNEVYHTTMDRLAALNGIRRTTRQGCQ